MAKIEGGCLCGAVSYKSESDPVVTAACHCKDCQKHSGSAFGLYVAVPKGSLEIKGKELKTFEGKGGSGQSQNYFHRTFCGSCGSSVYAAIETPPDLLFVHAGTLDDTTWVKPDVQAWTGRQLPCVNVPDGNKFDGNLPTE